MRGLIKYGPSKRFVEAAVWLSWPIIYLGKKLSAYPVLRWIINPFFAFPYNDITPIPIGVQVPQPENRAVPRNLLERLIRETDDWYIFDTCICRNKLGCQNYPADIGCMAFGAAVKRVHPSNGRLATQEEAIAHVRRAEAAGLTANVAHVWIDPLAYGLNFNKLMFFCFCDDCCCLYRRHIKKRGDNLDKAIRKLSGVAIKCDTALCDGCGACREACYVDAPRIVGGVCTITDACKGCGRCVAVCPNSALSLELDDEDAMYAELLGRVRQVADIS